MIVCVAEKPSVGEYIAKVLGANQRKNGYFEGNGYQVTWTFGHLCALYDPQEYTEQKEVGTARERESWRPHPGLRNYVFYR